MDHILAPLEAPLTRSDETVGKTSRLSQIPCAFAKACFFALVVAGLSDCSSMVYAPKAAARTGTVRSSTVNKMEALNMDRAAPMLIRIYKEERTLEIWKQDWSGKFALLNSYPTANFQEILGRNLCKETIKHPRVFTTSLQIK
jgi:hypothetical protein